MKIKWHGKAPWGFPPVKTIVADGREDKAEAPRKGKEVGIDTKVCFMPGSVLDLPKEWLIHWHKIPSVAAALKRGHFGGLEVEGKHEKVLTELYGPAAYFEQATEQHIEQLKADKQFLINRTKTELPISPEEFVKSHQIAR